MTAYHVLWPLERSYENVMRVLPYVISNYSLMQISHTACIRSTPFLQSSSPPPPSSSPPSRSTPSPSPWPSPPSQWPPSQSPASGILLFDFSSTTSSKTLLPAKPDPPLPACSLWSHFHLYQQSQIHCYQLAPSKARLSERWEWEFHCYQFAPSEARSTANRLLPAKPDCQRWQLAFHRNQLAPSEARSTATCEARSTAKSLLPAKPDCQRGESGHSTTTSLLPAKPDPLLTACSLRSEIVRGESEHSTATSRARSTANSLLPARLDCQRWERAFHRYQRSQIVRGESEHSTATSLLPAKPHRQRVESEHVRAVRRSISEVGKWICQSCVSEQISGESEHVRVGVGASMSELLEWACQCTHVTVVNK